MDHRVSGLEQLARDFFKETLPNEKVVYNERFSWLLVFNPNFKKMTERELDLYFPNLRIGIEVNGGTHQHSLIRRIDKKKHALCSKNGVVLYDVWNVQDFWKLRAKLFDIYGPTVVAPNISQTLMDRLASYSARKMNKYEEQYLLRGVTEKNRTEQTKYYNSKNNKKPLRHREHQVAKEKARLRSTLKFKKREALTYAEDLD